MEVLGPKLTKALRDPRNDAAWRYVLTTEALYGGSIIKMDEDCLITEVLDQDRNLIKRFR
ncbi:hypothetical protein [Methylobacter sp.]|uniref:hypothetical protein n=1 Tax=Methylobacter sp. TaxID=2051955 RepID=UPI0012154440|nr:hypothetical protein [Methylobacter sp.]TAK59491.1 MAG: hypothetical protein EPO18_20225 [Methylobacter sp.]